MRGEVDQMRLVGQADLLQHDRDLHPVRRGERIELEPVGMPGWPALRDGKCRKICHLSLRRYESIQWLFFQMAFIGPMFGQLGFFYKFAGREFPDKRPLERYRDESKRLLGVLDTHLGGRQWIMDDDYTIADISMLGWVRNLIGFYGARELVAFDTLKHVPAWLERGLVRPAVQRGLEIPKRP
jgi:glutathione S-transferase